MNELKEVEQEITSVQTVATSLAIINNESYTEAGRLLTTIKKVEKTIKEYFKPLKDNAHRAWKAICDRENEEIDKLLPSRLYLDKQMTSYNLEQERIRRVTEERLRQEAVKREEEERLQAALQAEKEGNKAEAEAILSEPVFVPPPIVPKETPKVNGLTMVTDWKWKLADINLVPRQYLITNDTAINAVVKSLKDKCNIPGIEIYPHSSMRGVRQ